MAVDKVTHNNKIVPSWLPFIRIAIDELESPLINPKPAITILKEIQPLIEFCEQHADEDGMIHVA